MPRRRIRPAPAPKLVIIKAVYGDLPDGGAHQAKHQNKN
jgi:hypothetical protein